MADGEKLTLGGRIYRPLTISTLERDNYMMSRVIMAGITKLTMRHDETPTDFVQRILASLIVSGHMMDVLGGLLLPEGVEDMAWTPELAIRTGRELAMLTADEDKTTVRTLTITLLVSFLKGGLISLWQSAPPSETSEQGEDQDAFSTPTGTESSVAH